MQENVAKKMQENEIHTNFEFQKTIYNKNDEHLFEKWTANVISIVKVKNKVKTEDNALFNIFSAYDHLLFKLKKAKMTYATDSRLTTCINLAWKKMNEYYQKSDIFKVYFVAVVLDSRVKMRYFERNWSIVWLTDAWEKLKLYVKEFCSVIQVQNAEDDAEFFSLDDVNSQNFNADTTFENWRQCDEDDELTEVTRKWNVYLKSAQVKNYSGFSVHRWWIAHHEQFSILSQMTLKTLTISAMSIEIELVFSRYVHISLIWL